MMIAWVVICKFAKFQAGGLSQLCAQGRLFMMQRG